MMRKKASDSEKLEAKMVSVSVCSVWQADVYDYIISFDNIKDHIFVIHKSQKARLWKISFNPEETLSFFDESEFDTTELFKSKSIKAELISSFTVPPVLVSCSEIYEYNGKYLCCLGTSKGYIYIYDSNELHRIDLPEQTRIHFLRFHIEGPLLFVCMESGSLYIYNYISHKLLATLKGHFSKVTSLSFIKLSKGLGGVITSSKDKVINIWDLSCLEQDTNLNEDKVKKTKSNKSHKLKIDFDADRTFTIDPIYQIPADESIESVLCVPTKYFKDCKVLIDKEMKLIRDVTPWVIFSGGEKGVLTVWNPSTRTKLGIVERPHKSHGAIHYLSRVLYEDIYRLIVIGEDNIISIWNLETFAAEQMIQAGPTELIHGQWLRTPVSHLPPSVSNGTFSSVCVLTSDDTCTFMDIAESWTRSTVEKGHKDTVLCADVHASGCYVVTGSKDRSGIVWSSQLKKPIAKLLGHTAPIVYVQTTNKLSSKVECLCIDHTGNTKIYVVTVCLNNHMKVWNLDSSKLYSECQNIRNDLSDNVCVSMDAKHKINYKVKVSLASVKAHDKKIGALTLSPNDKYVATGSADKTIKLWKFPTLELIGEFKGHSRGISALQFSSTFKVLISGSIDKTVKIWNVENFTCVKTFENFNDIPLTVNIFNNGTQVATGGSNGIIRFYNVRLGDTTGCIDAHKNSKISSFFINKDNLALTAGSNNVLTIWKDFTIESEQEELIQKQRQIADQLAIESLCRDGKLLEALTVTLKLKRPQNIYDLMAKSFEQAVFVEADDWCLEHSTVEYGFQPFINRQKAERIGTVSREEFKDWVLQLENTLLETLFKSLILSSNNGRLKSITSYILEIIVKHVPSSRLLKFSSFEVLASTFLKNNVKHASRLSALLQRTFLFDIILYSSGCNLLHSNKSIDESSDYITSAREILFD